MSEKFEISVKNSFTTSSLDVYKFVGGAKPNDGSFSLAEYFELGIYLICSELANG